MFSFPVAPKSRKTRFFFGFFFVNYRDFSYSENMISSHVKINLISADVKISMMSHVQSSLPSSIVERTKIYFYMIDTSSKIAWKYSAFFANLRKSSDIFGNFWKMIRNVRMNFGQSREFSDIFRKCSEIFGKLLKSPQYCCLYNKQNISYPLVDMNFIFSRSALTREISSWTLEDKIRVHARACNILYLSNKISVSCLYTLIKIIARHSAPEMA